MRRNNEPPTIEIVEQVMVEIGCRLGVPILGRDRKSTVRSDAYPMSGLITDGWQNQTAR